jgi:ribosomal protein S27E
MNKMQFIQCTRCSREEELWKAAFGEGWNIAIDPRKNLYNVRCPDCACKEYPF